MVVQEIVYGIPGDIESVAPVSAFFLCNYNSHSNISLLLSPLHHIHSIFLRVNKWDFTDDPNFIILKVS